MTTLTAQSAGAPGADHSAARRAMIDSQLRTSGVSEPWVLAAMAALPREGFVPAAWRDAAYIDRAIPLGEGRWLAAPLVHARFLEEAAPKPGDRALLIGQASGYLAALLRPLVSALDTAEPGGQFPAGPYSLVIVDGAIEELPGSLAAAVADGGRLVIGTVKGGVTRLAVGRKVAGQVALLDLAELGIPVLPQFTAPKRWSF